MSLRVTRHQWDIAFLLSLPLLALAAGIGVLFGGPLDNLIVLCWLLPIWSLVRTLARKNPASGGGADCHPG